MNGFAAQTRAPVQLEFDFGSDLKSIGNRNRVATTSITSSNITGDAFVVAVSVQ